MKRALHVTLVANELRGFQPVGGMGTATTFLALALARMGHAVEILIGWRHAADAVDPHWAGIYRDAGIRLRSAAPSEEPVRPPHFDVARRIEVALRTDPPDVVITQDIGAPAYSALRLRDTGVAFENTLFVVFCHGPRRYILELGGNVGAKDLRDILGVSTLERASIELADVVVSPSAYLIEWMRSIGWSVPERTLVIPYFTRSSALGEHVARREDAGDRLQRLAFFGRLDDKKGVHVFAAGLNALEPELIEGIEVVFVGKPTRTWPIERTAAELSESTKRALRRVSFETQLDQHDALELLGRPGTLAVLPSLQENSPNAVYECLEHGIPFIASEVGGVPELIADDDHDRVLFEPTPDGMHAALRRALASRTLCPARASFTPTSAYDAWQEVLGGSPRRRAVASEQVDVDVIVHSRSAEGYARCVSRLERQTYSRFRVIRAETPSIERALSTALREDPAPYALFLDEDDLPDDELIETLVAAQAASGADAVTCGVRVDRRDGRPTLHLFAGEPEGLGVLANWYGVVALLPRSALPDLEISWPAERDTHWQLLAAIALANGRIVSVPLPLVTRASVPGSVEHDGGDALLAVHRFERALPFPLRGTARIAAGLASNTAVLSPPKPRLLPRLLRRLHLASAR